MYIFTDYGLTYVNYLMELAICTIQFELSPTCQLAVEHANHLTTMTAPSQRIWMGDRGQDRGP